MTAPALVSGQASYSLVNSVVTSIDAVLTSSPTAGNLMVVVAGAKDTLVADFIAPTGFTEIANVVSTGGSNVATVAYYREVQSGDGATHSVGLASGGQRMWVAIFEFANDWTIPTALSTASATGGTTTTFTGTPASGSALVYAVSVRTDSGGFGTPSTITVAGDSSSSNISGFTGYDASATAIEQPTWTSSKQWSGIVVEIGEGAGSDVIALASFDAAPTFYTATVRDDKDVVGSFFSVAPTFTPYTVGSPGVVELPFTSVTPTFPQSTLSSAGLPMALADVGEAIALEFSSVAPTFHGLTVDSAASYWYTPPTVTVTHQVIGAMTHTITEGRSVLITAGVATLHNEPTMDQVAAADVYLGGGRRHLVTGSDRIAIEAAGIGGTFEEVS